MIIGIGLKRECNIFGMVTGFGLTMAAIGIVMATVGIAGTGTVQRWLCLDEFDLMCKGKGISDSVSAE